MLPVRSRDRSARGAGGCARRRAARLRARREPAYAVSHDRSRARDPGLLARALAGVRPSHAASTAERDPARRGATDPRLPRVSLFRRARACHAGAAMRAALAMLVLVTALAIARADAPPETDKAIQHNFAGSIQFDYLTVPTERLARPTSLDAATNKTTHKHAVDLA